MNKQVAIVTPNHGVNYGNKLQNYAVQEVYRKLDCVPTTIKFFPEGAKVENKQKVTFGILIKKINRRITERRYSRNIQARMDAFETFNETYLIRTDRCYSPTDYNTINERDFDFFSVGSDQVWNSYFFDFSPIYLLDFIRDGSKKIAYAASFGVSDIASEYVNLFSKALSDFKAISVREDKAKEIVETISDNKAQVVLDPTLMLTTEDWDRIIPDVKEANKYILTYFLGELSKERWKIIASYARKNNYKIIRLNDIKNKYYRISPLEFVSFIKHAEVVFTDSFHACCFSLQYKKKFWVMNRLSTGKEMGSRIDTFLSKFYLDKRRFYENARLSCSVDYEQAYVVLEQERVTSWSFLKVAIGEQNDNN